MKYLWHLPVIDANKENCSFNKYSVNNVSKRMEQLLHSNQYLDRDSNLGGRPQR